MPDCPTRATCQECFAWCGYLGLCEVDTSSDLWLRMVVVPQFWITTKNVPPGPWLAYTSFEEGYTSTISIQPDPGDLLHTVLGPGRTNPMQEPLLYGFTPFGSLERYRSVDRITSLIDASAAPYAAAPRHSNVSNIFAHVRVDHVVYTDSTYP